EDGKECFVRRGVPFVLYNKLLYNIYPNRIRSLYIPKQIVKNILEITYNNKYYFGRNRILYNLRNVIIFNKIRLVRKYVEYYLAYTLN
ncbi:hypothetical protein NEUTE1DRAFT_51751, partial [Neurospora tetrasperma FGSC 2508]